MFEGPFSVDVAHFQWPRNTGSDERFSDPGYIEGDRDVSDYAHYVCNETCATFASKITHCSRENRKRVIGKQCRPRSDAAERGV